eukprot:gene3939-6097_t
MKRQVEVAVRIRPPNERERFANACVYKVGEDAVTVVEEHRQTNFTFDRVFDASEGQLDVYQESIVPVVDVALEGGSGLIFAYGQTGSGKTHTILGEVSGASISDETGVFLRVLAELLRYKARRECEVAVDITLSAIEVYNDEPRDLLDSGAQLVMREIGEDCTCPFVQKRSILTLLDAVEVFRVADAQRSSSATKMNKTSSRSHALFLIDVTQAPKNAQPGQKTVRSRLSIVDLAGSERIK